MSLVAIRNLTRGTVGVALPHISLEEVLEKCESRDPDHGVLYHLMNAPIPEFYRVKFMDDILRQEVDKYIRKNKNDLENVIRAFKYVMDDCEYRIIRMPPKSSKAEKEEYIISKNNIDSRLEAAKLRYDLDNLFEDEKIDDLNISI